MLHRSIDFIKLRVSLVPLVTLTSCLNSSLPFIQYLLLCLEVILIGESVEVCREVTLGLGLGICPLVDVSNDVFGVDELVYRDHSLAGMALAAVSEYLLELGSADASVEALRAE